MYYFNIVYSCKQKQINYLNEGDVTVCSNIKLILFSTSQSAFYFRTFGNFMFSALTDVTINNLEWNVPISDCVWLCNELQFSRSLKERFMFSPLKSLVYSCGHCVVLYPICKYRSATMSVTAFPNTCII